MIAPPRDTAGNEQGIFDFYRRVAERTSLPVCVQDHPVSSGVTFSVSLLLRLIAEIPQIAAVKVESVPSPRKIEALSRGSTRPEVRLLGGLGALYSYFELLSGSAGIMTGFGFPEILLAMWQAHAAADTDRVFHLYRQYLPLIVFEQQAGVAIR